MKDELKTRLIKYHTELCDMEVEFERQIQRNYPLTYPTSFAEGGRHAVQILRAKHQQLVYDVLGGDSWL